MAYDGLLLRAQLNEIGKIVLNERISKISQTNNKNVSLLFRKNNNDIILSININPNFPYISIINEKLKTNQNPYAFTMLLRKYLEGGKIININQIDGNGDYNSLERIVELSITNTIETGDIKNFKLIIELLGRYANVILTDSEYNIIDVLYKIKENNEQLRVLKPKDKYSTKELYKKHSLMNINYEDFMKALKEAYDIKKLNKESINCYNIFLQAFYGLSKTYIINLIHKHNIDENKLIEIISNNENNNDFLLSIYANIMDDINKIKNSQYYPTIYYENNKIKDLHIFKLNIYNDKNIQFDNICKMINKYVEIKYGIDISNEKIKTLKDRINKLIEKTTKKISLNEGDIEKSKDYDTDKLYADLIQTFGYNNNNIKNGILYCENFKDNSKMTIKLNTEISIQKNAEYYYNSYNKKKRTIEKSTEQIKLHQYELEHLNNLQDTLKYLNENEDIIQLENELNENFKLKNTHNINKKNNNKSLNIKHFRAIDGTDIYVGKNNIQNDYVTFQIAESNDTWLHVKNATGSHVIIKKEYEKIDLKTLEQAASLAAYYSSLKNEQKVTVDYTYRKEIKKVKGKPLGYVIYHKNYSINVEPGIFLKEIK